jgi:hypothetical protein
MFSTLRTRFGIPGVISVIALVFAMFGGAYAASNSASGGGKATASAKAKKGPRGPKGATGPAGPQGPAGPTGSAGPKGDVGAAGSNGASVTSTESANAIEGHCTGTGNSGKGGSKFVSASGTTYACNGKEGPQGEPGEEGSPWTAGGKLPEGATETGNYFVGSETGKGPIGEAFASAAISFPIPLSEPILDPDHVIYLKLAEAVGEHCENTERPGTASSVNPEADPGYLCVYEGLKQDMTFEEISGAEGQPANVSGTNIAFETDYEGEPPLPGYTQGTWAVTAP